MSRGDGTIPEKLVQRRAIKSNSMAARDTTLARHGARLFTILVASAMALTLAPAAMGQDVVWTRQFGTVGEDIAFGISIDASGVYVVG